MAVATMAGWRGIGYARCDMSLQAPAIVDVRPIGTGAAAGIATWLRGIGVRQVRIATGLVLFAYIFSHFFNHALGNISYATMEAWLQYHIWFWRIPVVNFVLYAAAIPTPASACGRSISAGIFATPSPRSRSSHWGSAFRF